ncbi:MAG: PASTA domain-containing protein [Bacteroidetes bacterium]|nr:PASTA domain-containing protein [Bacteroidota bacterium]MCH8523338.1 PASTA domain-containing protein [Balneolales bacterium]
MLRRLFTSPQLYIYISSLILLLVAFIFLMDRVIMPWYTNYNEGITVPDVTKISLNEAEALLAAKGLRFVVSDRRPHEAFPPDYIIDQSPVGTSKVKPNRKVYLTVATSERPVSVVPEVENTSLNNARIQLQNHGLRVGNISVESSRFRNIVLRQSIPHGTTVDRGTVVDLVISDGLGQQRVQIPDIVGLRLAEGQRLLRDAGLRVGSIQFRATNEIEPNHILAFSPNDRAELFEGESLNLVVSEPLSVREEAESGTIFEAEPGAIESLQADTLRPSTPPQE